MLADSVSDESSLPGLQMAALLCPMVERERMASLVSLLIRALILSDYGSTLMTSFNLNYLLKGHISKYSHTGVTALLNESRGDKIQSMTRTELDEQEDL